MTDYNFGTVSTTSDEVPQHTVAVAPTSVNNFNFIDTNGEGYENLGFSLDSAAKITFGPDSSTPGLRTLDAALAQKMGWQSDGQGGYYNPAGDDGSTLLPGAYVFSILNSGGLAGTNETLSFDLQSVASTGGDGTGSPSTPNPTPTTPSTSNPGSIPQGFPAPIGTTNDGEYIYDLGNGIRNLSFEQPEASSSPLRTRLRELLRNMEDGSICHLSNDSTLTDQQATINGNPVGPLVDDGNGRQSAPFSLNDLPNGLADLGIQATDTVTGQQIQVDLPISVDKGIQGQPYSTEVDILGDYLNGIATSDTVVEYKNNGRIYDVQKTTDNPDGSKVIDYQLGTELERQNEFGFSALLDAAGNAEITAATYNDGSHEETAHQAGQTLEAAGHDTMSANGSANTTFVFQHASAAQGDITVTDFNPFGPQHGTLSFANSQFSSIAQILHVGVQVGNDTVFHLGPQSSVTLQNVSLDSLHRNDFSLHP